jgi:hypothetical protein
MSVLCQDCVIKYGRSAYHYIFAATRRRIGIMSAVTVPPSKSARMTRSTGTAITISACSIRSMNTSNSTSAIGRDKSSGRRCLSSGQPLHGSGDASQSSRPPAGKDEFKLKRSTWALSSLKMHDDVGGNTNIVTEESVHHLAKLACIDLSVAKVPISEIVTDINFILNCARVLKVSLPHL